MVCWVGTKVCVPFLCVCVCLCLVVKSTLATVRLSISPVWQSWKKLLFGGQSHPTLIKGAARGREGWTGVGGRGEWRRSRWRRGSWRWGTKSLHTRATCRHLFFSARLPPQFHLLSLWVGNPTHSHVCWRHTGPLWQPWHRLLCWHLSAPNCSLPLALFYSSSRSPAFSPILPHCSHHSVISPSVGPWLRCNNKHSIQLCWCMTWVSSFACCRAKVRRSRWGGSEAVGVPGDATSSWWMKGTFIRHIWNVMNVHRRPQMCEHTRMSSVSTHSGLRIRRQKFTLA